MFPIEFKQLLALLCLGLCVSHASAQSQQQSQQQRETTQQHFSFALPAAGADAAATLAVELDGYDVSAFARVDGGMLYLDLDAPLSPGEHALAVLLFLPQGDIETLLEQSLTVSGIKQSQWQGNVTFNSSYRMDEKEGEDFAAARHLAGTGAIDVAGSTTADNWQLDAKLQAAYDSVSENNADDDEWAVADYKVSATYQGQKIRAAAELGQVLIDRNDLLFSAFQRRGMAAAVADQSGGYQLQVFGINSEPTTRYDGDYLPANSTERSAGATGSVALVGQRLVLSAGYIDGEGTLGGAGLNFNGDPTIYGGDSWNIALDSYWLNNSLWLHGEYAESKFDSDGIDLGNDAKTDEATQAMIKLSSDGDLEPGWFDYWSVLLHYQSVGADFYSMGNLSLPGDLELQRLYLQGARGGLALDLEWAEEQSNIDNDPLLPTQTLQRQSLTLNYTPMTIDPDNGVWQLLGMPALTGSYLRTDKSQPQADAQISGYDLDNLTDQYSLGLQFSKQLCNWSVRHEITEFDDRSQAVYQSGFLVYEPSPDTHNVLTEWQVGWTPSERVVLNLYLQWNRLEESTTDNVYHSQNYGVDGYFQLIPGTLDLTMSYNLARDRSDLGSDLFIEDDFRTDVGNLQLTWKALQANQQTPSVDFYLRSSYGKQDNRAFAETNETWAAYIGLEIQWAAGGQP